MPNMLTGETRQNEPEVEEYLTRVMQGSGKQAFEGGATALMNRPDFSSLLGKIDVPTLVVVGQADPVYPMAIARGMHDAIKGSTLAIVPGASHAAVFERPGHVAAAIADWSQRELGAGSNKPVASRQPG